MEKVLFLLINMNIGGTEKSLLNLLDTIPQEKYDVTLLLLEKSGGFMDYIPSWVHVEELGGWESIKKEIIEPPLKTVKEYLRELKLKRAFAIAFFHLYFKITGNRIPFFKYILKTVEKTNVDYDVAISYAGPHDMITSYTLFCVNAKQKIQWIHFDLDKLNISITTSRKLYRKFDKIYVVSDEARESFVKKIPELADRTETFLNRVSAKRCLAMVHEGEGFKDRFTGKRIITIGRLSIEKGQDIIPEVASKLKADGEVFRWYLVGDGKLRTKIEEECVKYNVCKEVIIIGATSNPYPYLKDSDLYVQTSFYEGHSVAIEEAKVFSLPIVSTDCAGVHEQLSGIERHYIVNRDIEEIYRAVKKELDHA